MAAITIQDLNNAQLDTAHIAELATSRFPIAMDRFGRSKLTLQGAIDTIKSIRIRGAWVSNADYEAKDVILSTGAWYICIASHRSGATFVGDRDAMWRLYQGVTLADLESALTAYSLGYQLAATGTVARNLGSKISFFKTPEDFGFRGVDVVLDTAAMNRAFAAINSGEIKGLDFEPGGSYRCGPLIPITKPVVINGYCATIIALADSWQTTGDGTNHVAFHGDNIVVNNLTVDGDQFSWTKRPVGRLVSVVGKNPRFTGLICRRSPHQGLRQDGVVGGSFIDCHFDDNAGIGQETAACSHQKFDVACTWNRNGYGFKKIRVSYADTSHEFAAFGHAIRYRSHHITIYGNHMDNGREGLAIGQGSHSISCFGSASGNDDGGYTVHSDNLGTTRPGDGEACYDLDLMGDTSNNYGSGVALYRPGHNIRVRGKHCNNHRLAGDLAAQSSHYNAVYVAGGSTVDIDVTAYDDRQHRVIAGIAGAVITATGWVPGTMLSYPKVAFYSGLNRAFKGYGKIAAEADGVVTISPTAIRGVDLSGVTVGDYITQAVQHLGVFTDNNCQGVVKAVGAGHQKGPGGIGGRLIESGAYASGQNIILPAERLSGTELLSNPTFDAGTTGWAFSLPAGGAATWVTTGAGRRSAGALRLTAGAAPALIDADAVGITSNLEAMQGTFVEAKCWLLADARADVSLLFFWVVGGVVFSTRVVHPGGGWELLLIGAKVPAEASAAFMRIGVASGKTVTADTASLRAVDLHMDSRQYMFPTRSLPF